MMEKNYHRKKKDKYKQMMDNEKSSKGLHNGEVLVCLVLIFGMDHIRTTK